MINGADGLTYRLAEQLSSRYGSPVVVLMTRQQRLTALDFEDLPGVRTVVVDRLDEAALGQANLATAAGLALTVQDDVGNIHVALQARDVAPGLRLVVRMYNTNLGHNIETLLGDCKVLSDAEIAAPALVASALGEVAANPVRVGRRTLIVARRADVAPNRVVCGLAVTDGQEGPSILPASDDIADLVLAEGDEKSNLESTQRIGATKPKRASWFGLMLTFVSAVASRKTRIAVTVVLGIIAAAGVALGMSLGLPGWEGFYSAAATVLTGPQPNAGYTTWQQALQLVLGIAGLAFIPLITAVIVEGSVRARLAVAQVRLQQPHVNHVVVVGLGGVGTRVLRLLHDRGIKVVAIAASEQARGVSLARELEIPLIIGEPSRESTLRMAGVERCRALMAVERADVSNLETALHGRNLQERLHVVLRLFDGDLAARVRRTFNLPLSRSVSYLAAPAFAEALMDREVIGTFSVGRRVLLLAEASVVPGSALEGKTIGEVDTPGMLRVIALTEFGEPRPLWRPAAGRRIGARDMLTVVASRDGLSNLVSRSART
ncbi:potassium transporter TrkA [Rhizocola hellebori]|uniref:Potassium transporter TrkA n=1 Tax=Rhizocola hellebori TaxID=1392758 RepID=A0A8J3VKJ9_9ACTN|nr:potassium transporter TrkA [Rhizocola hellebori]